MPPQDGIKLMGMVCH